MGEVSVRPLDVMPTRGGSLRRRSIRRPQTWRAGGRRRSHGLRTRSRRRAGARAFQSSCARGRLDRKVVGLGEAAPAASARHLQVALLFDSASSCRSLWWILLVDAGHRAHERGLASRRSFSICAAYGRSGATIGERVVVRDGALEREGQGQRATQQVVALVDLLDVGDDVAVRDHHALAAAAVVPECGEDREGRRRQGSGGSSSSETPSPVASQSSSSKGRCPCRPGA